MKEVTETFICDRCGTELDLSCQYELDKSMLCPDCYDELTTVCEHCGERFLRSDDSGDENITLCPRCYENHYTTCEDCGRIISYDNAHYLDDNEDYPYCNNCFDRHDRGALHDYCYKPEPIFFGEGNRFFGVELELDDGGKSGSNAEELTDLSCGHLYVKTDGSLDDGIELVTHPMTLDYHRMKMPWSTILQTSLDLGYRSHKTSTCGLHVHVCRSCFGDSREAQDDCISRILYFVEKFWDELLKFSRRTENQVKRWAARYGMKLCPKEVLDTAKSSFAGRYTCVNLCNVSTIEFRIFRGTLKLNTIIATLQMVDAICDVALFMSDEDLQNLSWCRFVESLNPQKYPELITYLKERRLYINEPVTQEEDN